MITLTISTSIIVTQLLSNLKKKHSSATINVLATMPKINNPTPLPPPSSPHAKHLEPLVRV